MRKFTLFILALLLTLPLLASVSLAQTNDHWSFAADFAKWQVTGQAPSIYTWSSPSFCLIPGPYGSTSFFAFATNAPVYIQDFGTPANSETVTPTTIITSPGCGFTATFAHAHASFQIESATGGLQETLNALAKSATHASVVVLDQAWYNAVAAVGGTPATIIGAAAGGTGIELLDITQTPPTSYVWVSTKYQANGLIEGSGAPSGACTAGAIYSRTDATGGLDVCVNGTWTAVTIP